MASSGNFCTYSSTNVQGPAGSGTYTATKGNLGGTTTSGSTSWVGTTFGLPSGKWYFEARSTGATSGWPRVGFYSMGAGGDSISSVTSETSNNLSSLRIVHNSGCGVEPFGSTSVTEITGSVSSGDIVQIAIDVDAGKIWYGVNNTYLASGNPATGANAIDDYTAATYNPVMPCVGTYNSQALPDLNFGQDDTFAGAISSAGNADGNGFGAFKYSPPSGFLAICTANLPISEDIDPAETDDDYPAKQFGAVTYTGNSPTGQAITGLGFKPDLVWAKMRNSSQSHFLSDTTRGINKFVFSDNTNAEGSTGGYATVYSSFDSDGFTFSTSGSGPNDNSRTYVAWCWKANEGVTASNTSGDINSTTQANTKSGFSIVTYTGNGSVAQSIGHGLSSGAPEFIIVKNRSQADAWAVYHVGTGNAAHLILDTNAAQTTSSAYWGSFTPTTTLFKVGSDHKLNASGENYVAYLWHGVEGYSKFGTYKGNGNADGPFLYTGFRPRLFVQKRIDSTGDWRVWDSERHTFNPNDAIIRWETSGAEDTANGVVDFLSNGVKIRMTYADMNANNGTFVYMAWADVPFKYNNSF